jgi:hypothetical protein
MTNFQLQHLSWQFQSSLAMEHEHATVYAARIGFRSISKCVHTIKKADGTFGRSYTHYLFEGKVFKSHSKVLEAINQYLKTNKQE